MLKAERPSRKKEKLLAAVQEGAPKKRLNVEVDAALYRRIRARALEEERSVSEITRQFWIEYLSK